MQTDGFYNSKKKKKIPYGEKYIWFVTDVCWYLHEIWWNLGENIKTTATKHYKIILCRTEHILCTL